MQEFEFNHRPDGEAEKNISEKVELRKGIQPAQMEIVDSSEGNEELDLLREEATYWVDFEGGDLEALEAEGFKHDGPESYLISPVDTRNWLSDHYFSCTGVVGIGRDAGTGKEISFLSHQDPNYFIDGGYEKPEKFAQALKNTLLELKVKSQENTVEVLLLGGNFNPSAKVGDYHHDQ